MSEPSPSATVVLLRDAPRLQVLLVQRHQSLRVHGGAWAFPGGRLEAPDHEPGGDELLAAQRAAVREAHEECGLTLAATALVPLSHWTTPEGRAVRFSTWFFLAALGRGHDGTEGGVTTDGTEIVAARFIEPQGAIDAHHAEAMDLPPPTFVTLSVLARHRSVSEAITTARAAAPEGFSPRPRSYADGVCSLYEGDAAYEGAPLDVPGPRRRLWMPGRAWRFEHSA